jgi:hypothetical protein
MVTGRRCLVAERDDGCRQFREIRFTEARAQLIGWIRGVVDEYAAEGMSVTVRQIYYQAVARGIRGSGDRTYDEIQSALNKGRLAGLIPWTAVVDRGRGLRGLRTESSPEDAIAQLRRAYLRDLWEDQPYRPEVWVEKQALEGVIGDICSHRDYRVDYYATKGYDSQSQQYEAGQRLARYIQRGQRPVIFHLGDHDPSGVDMTRDVGERISMFVGVPVMVVRLALTMTQIERYDPPPFAVKRSDSRSDSYRAQYGDNAWELDALDPKVLRDLIHSNIDQLRDQRLWDASVAEETTDLQTLDEILEGLGGGEEDEK